MKFGYACLLLLFVSSSAWAQQNILAGDWEGKLTNLPLRLVFHFTPSGSGFTATLDSPDQGAKGLHLDTVILNKDTVTATLKMAAASYVGVLSADGQSITGKWQQRNVATELNLKKGTTVTAITKPQTPQPPFAYTVEEVEYDNGNKSVHLAGTLTYPKGKGPFPTVVLITGSGQQDRDETIMNHKPFAVIADYLTKQGMAVLRVDDRGMGKSKGDVLQATSADFAQDVLTSINFLKTHAAVDAKKIGLIGHSEGGLIAAITATQTKDVRFAILLAGPGTTGLQLMIEQNKKVLTSQGLPQSAVDAYCELYKVIGTMALQKDTAGNFEKAMQFFKEWQQHTNLADQQTLRLTSATAGSNLVHTLLSTFTAPWFQYFLKSNAPALLQHTHIPVLALNGEKDIQVVAEPNIEGLKKALAKTNPKSATKIFPGLNHLFQTCKACTVAEYGTLEESFSPEVLQYMSNWLKTTGVL